MDGQLRLVWDITEWILRLSWCWTWKSWRPLMTTDILKTLLPLKYTYMHTYIHIQHKQSCGNARARTLANTNSRKPTHTHTYIHTEENARSYRVSDLRSFWLGELLPACHGRRWRSSKFTGARQHQATSATQSITECLPTSDWAVKAVINWS